MLPRPTSRRASRTTPRASSTAGAESSPISADEEDQLEKVIDALLLERGDLRRRNLAAPRFEQHAAVGELLLDAVGIRVGLVDLVDRDDDRHLGGARVVDGLDRLRHDAVIGGDDEHDDVRRLRAARAHRGERLVARRIEEDDRLAVGLDAIRADVLRDAAGLAGGDVRLRGSRRGGTSCRGRRGP